MPAGTNTSRTHLWLESLGEWAWPGQAAAADALPLPPAWVPAFPHLAPAAAAHGASIPRRTRATARGILLAGLLSALGAVCCALALKGSLTLDDMTGTRGASRLAPISTATAAGSSDAPVLPTLVAVSHDSAGSSIDRASFASAALPGEGSFLVYLPPGFASTTERYPVLYLLHGRNGHASAFLEAGVQQSLDRLIAAGSIPPMIAVMVQDRDWRNNWRDIGTRHSAGYVVEVQELIDRMLPTVAGRAGRAIAGSSMGGFGAMHVALANPYRFSVVESWLGYFNHLEGELRADRPIIKRLGLQAFVYGAEADPVALPEENPWFAAELRKAGAHARSAIYPGGHSLAKVSRHLDAGLLFAGRALRTAQRRAEAEAVSKTAIAARNAVRPAA